MGGMSQDLHAMSVSCAGAMTLDALIGPDASTIFLNE